MRIALLEGWIIPHHICKTHITVFFFVVLISNARDGRYGLNNNNIAKYEMELDTLRRIVHIWPPPNQSKNKWELIQMLDLVAARRTYSVRPITRPLQIGDPINDMVVLKRTHSDMGNHVLLPNNLNRNWKYMSRNMEVPGCMWLAQSYVYTLASLGEWRVFLMGGQIVYVVHTVHNPQKGTWTWDVPVNYYSLEELRYFETHHN
jgi:hypothetical protein